MNTLFKKIELIPLETTNSSLVGRISSILYIKDDYFITIDKQGRIIVFDQLGNFISNSKNVEGSGPNEYFIGLSVTYNYFTGNIEVVTPNRTIMSYDILFNFVGKEQIESNEECLFYKIFPINKDQCILIPSILAEEPNVLFFYDRKKRKMTKKLPYDQVFAGLTQSNVPIRYFDGDFYFTPTSLTYLGYTIDCKNLDLIPEFQFNFKKDNLSEQKVRDIEISNGDINEYLAFKSSYPLPLQNIFNNSFVVSLIRIKSKYHLFIKNRKTGSEVLFNAQLNDGLRMPEFFTIEGNVLFALIQADSIEENVDIALLDENGKKVLNTIIDDDNPIIVKYHLKI